MDITPAKIEELSSVLELQYLAYQSEARLLNNFSLPPLKETLAEVEQYFHTGLILKAVDEKGAIIGSVRGHVAGETLFIGKLMVHPDRQGKGLGSRLLREMEDRHPGMRYELFTSDRSANNLRLYEKYGYRRFKETEAGPDLRLVYLEKVVVE